MRKKHDASINAFFLLPEIENQQAAGVKWFD